VPIPRRREQGVAPDVGEARAGKGTPDSRGPAAAAGYPVGSTGREGGTRPQGSRVMPSAHIRSGLTPVRGVQERG